jgi:hypothetical protein
MSVSLLTYIHNHSALLRLFLLLLEVLLHFGSIPKLVLMLSLKLLSSGPHSQLFRLFGCCRLEVFVVNETDYDCQDADDFDIIARESWLLWRRQHDLVDVALAG